MSVYFQSLSGDVKTRYLAKIKLIENVDPYDCDETGFSRVIGLFPNIGAVDIFNYLVHQRSAYTLEEFHAYKSLEAYKYYEWDWVRDIVVKKMGKNILVMGKVLHSMRLNEELLHPWLIAKPDGRVLCAHCTCIAGLGEACNHVGAVLFAIMDAKSTEPDVSVTGVKAAWKVCRGKIGEVGPWKTVMKNCRVVRKHPVASISSSLA